MLAKSRADESLFTFGLETKGEFNVVAFLIRNWLAVFLATLAGIGVFSGGYYKARHLMINRHITSLKKEEAVISGLMQQVQKECFEEGKMNIDEYTTTMLYYQKQLADVVQKRIHMEAEKVSVMKFRKSKALVLERDKLLEIMKQTQRSYLEEGRTETVTYTNMMDSLNKRLAVVEEELTLREVKSKLKTEVGRHRILARLLGLEGNGVKKEDSYVKSVASKHHKRKKGPRI